MRFVGSSRGLTPFKEAPAWWVWYETGWSAIADRLVGPDGERVDPSQPRYERDVRDWSLLPIPADTSVPGASPGAPGSPSTSAEPGDRAPGPPTDRASPAP